MVEKLRVGRETMPEPLVIRLFGPVEVEIDGQPMRRLRSRKGQLLLAHLILRHTGEVQRDWLCEALWPESLLEQARLSLRQSLVDLRKALGAHAHRIEAPTTVTLRFRWEGADVDLPRFDALIRRNDLSPEDVDRVLALYRGPLMDGWTEESLVPERESRRAAVLNLLADSAESARAEGAVDRAVRWLQQAIAIHPTHEPSYRSLMGLLVEGGHYAEALEAYRKLRQYLTEHLGIEPAPSTVDLYTRLRGSLQERHQSLASLDTPSSETKEFRIPRPLTPVLGREADLELVTVAVSTHRLVVVTGLGGVGKTRLLLEAARRFAEGDRFPDGVAYVSMGDLRTPRTVGEHLLQTLGVAVAPGASPEQQLADWLQQRRLLLCLDGCEDVAEEAALVLHELLESCPDLHILATSRERLGLEGEQTFALLPLAVPSEEGSPEEVRHTAAFSLFEQRQRLVAPLLTFSDEEVLLVGKLCRELDGIPLALELAAARVRTLSVPEILSRMERRFELLQGSERNRPPRHQAMETAIWDSYRILTQEQQRCFRELSVFVGGFTLESAERTVTDGDTLAHLTRMIDASLVWIPSSTERPLRYAMLDTIRHFGQARLEEAGELEGVRRRHFNECLRTAKASIDGLIGAEQVAWMRRVEAEHPNFRAALANCEENQGFVSLVQTLCFYWHLASNTTESRRWIDQALARTEGVETLDLARLFAGAGFIAWHRMELLPALDYLEKATTLAREAGDPGTLGYTLNGLGVMLRATGDVQRAYATTAEATELYRGKGDKARLARGLANLGRAAMAAERSEESVETFRESLCLFREVGDVRDFAHTQQSLAWAYSELGRFDDAREQYRESIETLAKLNDVYRLAWSVSGLSSLCYREERWEEAARLLGIVLAWEREHHFEVVRKDSPRLAEEVTAFRTALGDARFEELRDQPEVDAVRYSLDVCSRLSA